MKFKTGLILSTAFMCIFGAAPHAFASDEEAARLQKLFSSYLTDTKGVVEVKTDGDGFAVKLDFAPLAEKSGGVIKVSPIELPYHAQTNLLHRNF